MSDARDPEARKYDARIYRNEHGDELMLLVHGYLLQCLRPATPQRARCPRKQLIVYEEQVEAPSTCPLCHTSQVAGTWVAFRSALEINEVGRTLRRADPRDFEDDQPTREIPKPKKLNGKE